jgi:hypothetical protein
MNGSDPWGAIGGGIKAEGDPDLLDELTEQEVELLIEDDLADERRMTPVAAAQGITYIATGLWPLVHMRSFEAVTGPKLEKWLVKTVGLLVTAIGATLLAGARDRESRRTLRLLGITSAAALAGVDLYYAGKRRISPVYFGDAALELAFVAGWLVRSKR